MRWRKPATTGWTNAPVLTSPIRSPTRPGLSNRRPAWRPSTSYEYQACGKESLGDDDTPARTRRRRQHRGHVQDLERPPAPRVLAVHRLQRADAADQPGASRPTAAVFVAEKSGLIKVFDSLTDTTPTVFADLRTEVHNFWDRGLLGSGARPAVPGTSRTCTSSTPMTRRSAGTAPTWGTPGETFDDCPTPPGPTTDGCVVSGRLSRLTASGDTMTGAEEVLINDWCGQFPSHRSGTSRSERGGARLRERRRGGERDHRDRLRAAQERVRRPPGAGGGAKQTPPTAEGGPAQPEPAASGRGAEELDGTILRVDPEYRQGPAEQPPGRAARTPNESRVVAYGLRNPFRFAVRPNSKALWIGDVGWTNVEEINRLVRPDRRAPAPNFGWPCYEGVNPQPSYQAAGLNICQGALRGAWRGHPAVLQLPALRQGRPQRDLPPASSSIQRARLLHPAAPIPPRYNGALFFADYSRRLHLGDVSGAAQATPARTRSARSCPRRRAPVDLKMGPDGNLYYVDLTGRHDQADRLHVRKPDPGRGSEGQRRPGQPRPSPSTSTQPDPTDPDPGDSVTYSWDLDGDGTFGDSTDPPAELHLHQRRASSTSASRSPTPTAPPPPTRHGLGGEHPASATSAPRRRASPGRWATRSTSVARRPTPRTGRSPPPLSSWSLILHHCPSNCHYRIRWRTSTAWTAAPSRHRTTTTPHSSSCASRRPTPVGSPAPQSVRLDPKTAELTLESSPSGLSPDAR